MEKPSSLLSDIQRSLDAGVMNSKLGRTPGKVVMISSHSGWSARRKLRDDETGDSDIAADSVELVRVFHEVLERVRQGPVLNMENEAVTVRQMSEHLWRELTQEDAPIRLSQMLRIARSERGVICMFLALLELVRLHAVVLRQDRNLADILLKKNQPLASSS